MPSSCGSPAPFVTGESCASDDVVLGAKMGESLSGGEVFRSSESFTDLKQDAPRCEDIMDDELLVSSNIFPSPPDKAKSGELPVAGKVNVLRRGDDDDQAMVLDNGDVIALTESNLNGLMDQRSMRSSGVETFDVFTDVSAPHPEDMKRKKKIGAWKNYAPRTKRNFNLIVAGHSGVGKTCCISKLFQVSGLSLVLF